MARAEDCVTVLIPRSALQVTAPPLTVTQKTSLTMFGIPPRTYLRLAANGAFPVKVEGKLRVARCEDVNAYLTTGAAPRGGPKPPGPKAPPKPAGPPAGGAEAALRKAGFRW